MGRTGCSRARLWRSTEPVRAVLIIQRVRPPIQLRAKIRGRTAAESQEKRDPAEPRERRDPANAGTPGSRIKDVGFTFPLSVSLKRFKRNGTNEAWSPPRKMNPSKPFILRPVA